MNIHYLGKVLNRYLFEFFFFLVMFYVSICATIWVMTKSALSSLHTGLKALVLFPSLAALSRRATFGMSSGLLFAF